MYNIKNLHPLKKPPRFVLRSSLLTHYFQNVPGPLRPSAAVHGGFVFLPLPFRPPRRGARRGMAALAADRPNERHGLRLWGLQEIRGVLGVREAPVPHGAGSHHQNHRPHNLVRQVGAVPEEDNPRVHKLNLRRELAAPLRGGVVEDRAALHGPDRRQHFENGSARGGEKRPFVFSREVADPVIHSVRDKKRHHGEDSAVTDQPQKRVVSAADRR